jgi:hypothetical protein
MIPVQPLASSLGSGQVQVQRRAAQRAKSAFYRELLARRHDAYTSSEALPLPAEEQPPQSEPQNDRWVRATMSFPGGVSLTLERSVSDEEGETTTSLALTRRLSAPRRPAPQPRRVDIKV